METENPIQKLTEKLKSNGASDKTIASYVFFNSRFIEFTGKTAQEVEAEDIKKYVDHLSEKKSRNTVALAISSLRFYYDKILNKELFFEIRMPKKEHKDREFLEKEEVKRMIELSLEKTALVIGLLYGCGLKVGQLVNLKKEDLNIEDRIGTVRNGDEKRSISFILPQRITDSLKKYIECKNPQDFVFAGYKGKLTARNIQKLIKNAAKKAGISKKVTPNTLRSSFAAHLSGSGVNIDNIREFLLDLNSSNSSMSPSILIEWMSKINTPLDSL
ncbi:MAG: tyrosine-type recombinase/integrase [archaeon]